MGVLVGDSAELAWVRPPSPELLFPGLAAISWRGWDGIEYNLAGPGSQSSGVVLGNRVRGLHFGDLDVFTQESPAVDGASYQGYRALPREVFLTIRVYHYDGSQEWLDYDSAFWRSMLPAIPGVRSPGTLTVTQPSGRSRTIELYPTHRGDHEQSSDPSLYGWETYGQYLTAYRPFWRGQLINSAPFKDAGSSSFFGGVTNGKGPLFQIGPGAKFGSAAISNPGDEPAWPTWRLRGPFTVATIGTPAAQSVITATVGAGDWLDIDTDPLAQTVRNSSGAAVMPTGITGDPFAQVLPSAAGQATPLIMAMVGAGSIEVSLVPLYHKAW